MLHKRRLKVVELLLSQGFVTEKQIIKVIEEQKKTNRDIASLIVEMGYITHDELTAVLGEQIQVNSKKRLGEVLVDHAMITPEQLKQALEVQRDTHETIGHCLVRLKFIDEDTLLDVLGAQLDTPHVVLDHIVFNKNMLDLVPLAYIEQYKVVPLFLSHNQLTIAMSDPLNLRTLDHLRFTTGKDVDAVIASEVSIDQFIKRLKSNELQEINTPLDSIEKMESIDKQTSGISAGSEYGEVIVNIVNSLVLDAIRESASDIHIEYMREEVRVRFRIDGILVERRTFELQYHDAIVSRLKILSNLDVAEKRQPQDGIFHIHHNGHEVDIRVSTFPIVSQDRGMREEVVLRILDSDSRNIKFDDIGFPEDIHQVIRRQIQIDSGMILVAGPAGSGKTTTLYAVLKELLCEGVNIVTLEEQVEYAIDGISQGEIVPGSGITFVSGMSSVLHQDPDIIMVGEMRSEETCEMIIQAALTGHLVLSSLHTDDAPSAITRLVDMNIEPYLINSALKGVIAQRLVRMICPHCKEEYETTEHMRNHFEYTLPEKIFRGKGCQKCNYTGFKGRVPIFELIIPDKNIENMVLQNCSAKEIRKYAIEHGMKTMRYHGFQLITLGVTTLEEVLLKTEADQSIVK